MASTSPRCMAFRHATYRASIPDESLAPRAPALSVKCFYLLPNSLRLSGERSTAERVRCSRGLGGPLIPAPDPERDLEASQRLQAQGRRLPKRCCLPIVRTHTREPDVRPPSRR